MQNYHFIPSGSFVQYIALVFWFINFQTKLHTENHPEGFLKYQIICVSMIMYH